MLLMAFLLLMKKGNYLEVNEAASSITLPQRGATTQK
jgi:hypothetical protein